MQKSVEGHYMKANELLEYIFEDRSHIFVFVFAHWIKSSDRFKAFAESYRNKIRKKVNEAENDEVITDIRFELEMAYLMLQNNRFLKVEYEKCGTEERNPDFTVTCETGVIFNLEVKRIRKTKLETRFEAWKKDVEKQISDVPSTLALSMHIGGDLDTSLDLPDRLKDKTSDIINYIVNTIPAAEKEIPVDGKERYPVPGFEGELELEFRKPPKKPTSDHTSYYGGSFPIFNTQLEYRKFGDAICESLGQMRPGMINVLTISTDSSTHDDFDLGKAIASLNELAAQGNDDFFIKKGFEGVDDFLEHFKQLSGVLFRGTWVGIANDSNILWCNEEADHQIPEDISKILRRMN